MGFLTKENISLGQFTEAEMSRSAEAIWEAEFGPGMVPAAVPSPVRAIVPVATTMPVIPGVVSTAVPVKSKKFPKWVLPAVIVGLILLLRR